VSTKDNFFSKARFRRRVIFKVMENLSKMNRHNKLSSFYSASLKTSFLARVVSCQRRRVRGTGM